jgi:hypothetical protein
LASRVAYKNHEIFKKENYTETNTDIANAKVTQPHLANIFNISKVLVDMLVLKELDRFSIYNESSSDHLESLPDLEGVRKVQSRKSRMVEHEAHNARNIFAVVMNQVIILKAYLTWKK